MQFTSSIYFVIVSESQLIFTRHSIENTISWEVLLQCQQPSE
jgi:hypothetical protein